MSLNGRNEASLYEESVKTANEVRVKQYCTTLAWAWFRCEIWLVVLLVTSLGTATLSSSLCTSARVKCR